MSSVGKDLIKYAQVIILDHFLQRYIHVFDRQYTNFFSWRIHITKSKVEQIICLSKFSTLLSWFVRRLVLKT